MRMIAPRVRVCGGKWPEARGHAFLLGALLAFLEVGLPSTVLAQAVTAPMTVYVADFTSSNPADSAAFLKGVTDDFESILSDAGLYVLLERRRARDLELQVRNEAQLTSQPALVRTLKEKGAQGVVFGELQDDVDSGQYVFRVSLVRVDSIVVWREDASLSRGLVRDRDSRVRVLQQIVGDVRPGAPSNTPVRAAPTSAASSSAPRDGATTGPLTFEGDGFTATLVRLAMNGSGSSVVASISIENTSTETMLVAIPGRENVIYMGDFSRFAEVSLSDDEATDWTVASVSGIRTLKISYSRPSDFTALAPAKRVTVTMRFQNTPDGQRTTGLFRQGATTKAKHFTINAELASHDAAGLKRHSMSFADVPLTLASDR